MPLDVDKPRRKSKRRGEPDEAAFWLVTPPDLELRWELV